MINLYLFILFLSILHTLILCEDEKLWEYTPVSTSFVSNSAVICKLRYDLYHKKTALYSHFKELLKVSGCSSGASSLFAKKTSNTKIVKLDELLNSMNNDPDHVKHLKPSGFIFHESRVGSTLISNMLASDPRNLVFSEAPPPMEALKAVGYLSGTGTGTRTSNPNPNPNPLTNIRRSSMNETRIIEQFQSIVHLMGRTVTHDRLFFKFQSSASLKIKIMLKAFPDVPWVFVFRNPIQTMMSQLDPASSIIGGPCLRTRRMPHPKTRDALNPWKQQGLFGFSRFPNEAWCAAHLNTLCLHALSAHREYSIFKFNKDINTITNTNTDIDMSREGKRRSLFIDYQGLPGIVPRTMLKLFQIPINIEILKIMNATSRVYSKQRLFRMTPQARKAVINSDGITNNINIKKEVFRTGGKEETQDQSRKLVIAETVGTGVTNKIRNEAVPIANLNKMHAGSYKDDSVDKSTRATDEIKLWARRLLSRSYINMTSIMIEGFIDLLSPEEKIKGLGSTTTTATTDTGTTTIEVNWKYLKEFPDVNTMTTQEKN